MKKLKIYYGVTRTDLERVAINLLHNGMPEDEICETLIPRLRSLVQQIGVLGVCNLNDEISVSIETTNKACDIAASIDQCPESISIEFPLDLNMIFAGIQLAANIRFEEDSKRYPGYFNSLAPFVESITDGDILSALTTELFMNGIFRILESEKRGIPKTEDDPFYRGTDFYILDMLTARSHAAKFKYLPDTPWIPE